MDDGATARASRANRRAISVTYAVHKGPRGFANLVVEKQGGEIVLDEDAATVLFDVLGKCLG
ncbi:MAG: hypothetical protein ACRDRI_14495 [Pseudonocardiaceae bacterium]